MGVGRVAGAASELLLASGSDNNGVVHGSRAAGVERSHVENVNSFHLAENFQTLQTSGLLEIGRDGAGVSTRTEEVNVGLDLCSKNVKL